MTVRVQPTAQVDGSAIVGDGTTVWDLAQVREQARLGSGCVICRGAYVGPGVVVGDNVKLKEHALVYEPAELGDGVYVGPAAVLTNDAFPRSVGPDGNPKGFEEQDRVGVRVARGASIGAGAVCVAPVRVGEWALVAAGAVVTRDVPDFALVVGVPARQIGWVGRAGRRLEAADSEGTWTCPKTGALYREERAPDGSVQLVELAR